MENIHIDVRVNTYSGVFSAFSAKFFVSSSSTFSSNFFAPSVYPRFRSRFLTRETKKQVRLMRGGDGIKQCHSQRYLVSMSVSVLLQANFGLGEG